VKQQEEREPVVLSIGQFRPEKDHVLQIESMAQLFKDHPERKRTCRLVLIGSCRGESDQARLGQLQELCQTLNIADRVEFVVNQPFSVVQGWLRRSSIGIHTMWNEHFGIGIVEMMAAGLIVIAHNSGGPKSDIVVDSSGFLASTTEEYAAKIERALSMSDTEVCAMRKNAQESAKRFTDEVFAQSFLTVMMEMKILPFH
jgi:alpha-1,2-mannosyltransferase